MKKHLMLLWISMYPFILLAQISTVTEESSRNQERTTHEILFQLRSTYTPFISGSSSDIAPVELQNFDFAYNPDTTWTYDEMADHHSVMFNPRSFSQTFDIGDENNFTRNVKSYTWNDDSLKWIQNYHGIDWVNNMRIDSTLNMRFDVGGNTTYGDRYYYVFPASDGATSEMYHDTYQPETGWQKSMRNLDYYSEDLSLNWHKTYRYNHAIMEYELSVERWFEDTADYSLFEYKSYTFGMLTYWNRRYEKYNEDHETVYLVTHVLNSSQDGLVPSDSVSYVNTDEFAESKGFFYNNGKWELDTYSRTYEHASVLTPGEFIVDSALSYRMVYDSEADSMVAGDVVNKSVWVYDSNENMTEYMVYSLMNDEMIVFSKSTTEYTLVNDEYYPVINRYFEYSYTLGALYQYSLWQTLLDEYGDLTGELNFYFSESGDTTGGYKSLMYYDDFSFYSFNYEWIPELHYFVNTGFMMHAEGDPITQYAYYSAEYSSNRSIIVLHSMPAAVDPGPLFPILGDTLDIIISAYNPDMTHPALTADNLPETATFDPVTRRLYWEVDEETDRIITITAMQGAKSTTIDVNLVFDEFSVDVETESEEPTSVVLHQNYPNPFNPNTTISFELSKSAFVTLRVFNVLGQLVETVVQNELMTTGLQRFSFNASNLSSGVYYYRLDADDLQITKKMTLIK